MEKIITYFGQKAKVGCDEKCHKAWGMNGRPKIEVSVENDYCAYLSDDELEIAPTNPGTYEGGCAKPTYREEMLNKWCVRECERCVMSDEGKSHLPLKLTDYSKRTLC